MYCPKCGTENPDDAQVCNSCGSALKIAPAESSKPVAKTSGLAIIAMVLGILSIIPFICIITFLPALILGIISLVRIEKSGGRLTGRGLAITAIVVPIVGFFLFALMMPALFHIRSMSQRMVCSTNLSGIGKAMYIYACDYDDEFPRVALRENTELVESLGKNWSADDQESAFSGNKATITSCFYLLVRFADVTPKSFVCKSDSIANRTTVFIASQYDVFDKDRFDLWDFGPEPDKHCSYNYHMPFSKYALSIHRDPGMAVAADRNPWMEPKRRPDSDWTEFVNGVKRDDWQMQKKGNTIVHQDEGQNMLFLDGHVTFENYSYCALDDDNIYTRANETERKIGIRSYGKPYDKKDSFLIGNKARTASE